MTEPTEEQADDKPTARVISGDLSVGLNRMNTHVLLMFTEGGEQLALALDDEEAIQLGDALRKAAAMLREALKEQAEQARH